MDSPALFAFRLDVVALTVGDLVQSAGGLLFDRVAAGWDVAVGIHDGRDLEALRILGLNAQPLESAFESFTGRPAPHLAVAAEAWAFDSGVAEFASSTARSASSTLLLWGAACATGGNRRLKTVNYQPSAAARAFKAHALSAAAVVGDPDSAESFRSNRRSVATGLKSVRDKPFTGKPAQDRSLALAGQND
jgi:hypothetical protein